MVHSLCMCNVWCVPQHSSAFPVLWRRVQRSSKTSKPRKEREKSKVMEVFKPFPKLTFGLLFRHGKPHLYVVFHTFIIVACIVASVQQGRIILRDGFCLYLFTKVVSFYKDPGWTRKTYGRWYDVVAPSCFNVCIFMHYCTWPCCII